MSEFRKPRASRRRIPAMPPSGDAPEVALMVIDHERLQGAAWAEFHSARKRLEKTARNLHRHEEIDAPAYESWIHRTFPIQVTTLRELDEEVEMKTRKIQSVQMRAALFGGSLKRLWRQQKDREAQPETFDDPPETGESGRESGESHDHPDDRNFEPVNGPAPSLAARDIYRRLVQRLHPDRGGGWTAKRQQLWHEVQQAWQAADVDWLSRLEVEWETANEILGPASPLSRLRRAIEELEASRRDIERKLRFYRSAPSWRFTLNEKNRGVLHRRTEKAFLHDIGFLQRQLDHLNRTIAAWEEDWTRPDSRPRARRKVVRRY